MMNELAPISWSLTGEYKYERGWFGLLRLRVQEKMTLEVMRYQDGHTRLRPEVFYRWRAARFDDMAFLRQFWGDRTVLEKAA